STLDYCNGGPFFLAPTGAADWGPEQLPGVDVIARYTGLPHGALSRVRPAVDSAPPPSSPSAAAAATAARGDGVRQAVAAVRCRVGGGAAVLCGTHPELTPDWLDPCGLTPLGPRGAGGGAAAVSASAVPAPPAAAAAAVGVAVWPVASDLSPGAPAAAAVATVAAVAEPVAAAAGGAACPDAALARHTAALRGALAAEQPRRDELLRSLLVAALLHQGRADGLLL
ncbi:MAG: hypothetical protein J3K34DRAFT_460907, partial [Monoraphidium minutum]